MFLPGELGGGRGQSDNGPVPTVGGRQGEERIGDCLHHLRSSVEALLEQLLPGRKNREKERREREGRERERRRSPRGGDRLEVVVGVVGGEIA